MPSHYLNQCWNIVNWTLGNKIQWNLNRNSYIFIQENTFENVVWKMAAILSLPQCVNEMAQVHSLQWCDNSFMASQITGWRKWLFVQQLVFSTLIKKASLALCGRNPPLTGGFPSQRASNVERVSISWDNQVITEAHGFFMMTSSTGNTFHVTGHLCGEFTGPQWIPRTKASDAGLWCFPWSAPE